MNKHIVIIKLRCPGLSKRLCAKVYEVEDSKCDEWLAEEHRIGRLLDDRVHSYAVFDESIADKALALAMQINAEADEQLARWRHDVYGEPYSTAV